MITQCKSCFDVLNVVCQKGKRVHLYGLRCSCCHIVFTSDHFQHNKSRKDKVAAYCKSCQAIKDRERAERRRLGIKIVRGPHTPYTRTTNRIYHKSNNVPKCDRKTLRRFYAYRNQCARRGGLSFNLTLPFFITLTASPCFYCGCFPDGKNYCGIDRVDSSIGYEPSNCVPCCIICNRMKMRYSQQFFIDHILKIAKNVEVRKSNL